jgi:hypothetical protein
MSPCRNGGPDPDWADLGGVVVALDLVFVALHFFFVARYFGFLFISWRWAMTFSSCLIPASAAGLPAARRDVLPVAARRRGRLFHVGLLGAGQRGALLTFGLQLLLAGGDFIFLQGDHGIVVLDFAVVLMNLFGVLADLRIVLVDLGHWILRKRCSADHRKQAGHHQGFGFHDGVPFLEVCRPLFISVLCIQRGRL